MKRRITALVGALLCSAWTPLYAQTNVVVKGEVKQLTKDVAITDVYDAVKLKIDLNELKVYEGKTIKVCVALNGALWSERTGVNIQCMDLKNITMNNLGARDTGESSVEYQIKVPYGIKDEDVISFTVPLLIELNTEGATVKVTTYTKDNEVIQEGEELVIASTGEKKLTCEVGDIPKLTTQGVIAPLIFSEIYTASLSTQATQVRLTLNDRNVQFGEFDYISKQENEVDTDYILEAEQYVTYEEGFKGMNEDIKMKIRKDAPCTLIFTLKGNAPLTPGKIILKNIPVVVANQEEDRDLIITIEGEGLVNNSKQYKVAQLEAVETVEVKEEVQVKEEEENESPTKKTVVAFTIGKKGYLQDGNEVQTDVAPYAQAPGYIMVPVKSVAVALGIGESDISFKGDVVTLHYGEKMIELKKGSKLIKVNNVTQAMSTEAVIKYDRIFVPMGELAKLLGVDVQWISENKTAIFRN